MGEHYYTETPSSAHDIQTLDVVQGGRTLHFETDAGVFSKGRLDKGTALLLSALPEDFSGRALDVGCGWGAIGLSMAARFPQASVVMTDINARAVSLCRGNLQRNGLAGEVLQGDGLAAVTGGFDLIATNPPIRAGKAVVFRILAESMTRLSPDGAFYAVIRKQQGAESALRFLRGLGDAQVVARSGGYWVISAGATGGGSAG